MLFAVLDMPPKLWDGSELDVLQRHSRYVAAGQRIRDDADKIARLEAECAAMKADAWRYRWLKENRAFRSVSLDMGGNHRWTTTGREIGRGSSTDAAIDAAMQAGDKP